MTTSTEASTRPPSPRHLTEETLILRYYGEDWSDDPAEAERHLTSCLTCLALWRRLEADMAQLDEALPVPVPGDLEDRVWARVSRQLPTHAAPGHRWGVRQVVVLLAWAASVTAVVAVGRQARPVPAPTARVATVQQGGAASAAEPRHDSGTRERVLLAALDNHFSDTEMLLVELLNAPEESSASVPFERSTADDLLWSTRLYRQTAVQTGDEQMVDVLDELQPVLVEVARRGDQLTRFELAGLRERIEDNSLLFKVRAATIDVRERQQ